MAKAIILKIESVNDLSITVFRVKFGVTSYECPRTIASYDRKKRALSGHVSRAKNGPRSSRCTNEQMRKYTTKRRSLDLESAALSATTSSLEFAALGAHVRARAGVGLTGSLAEVTVGRARGATSLSEVKRKLEH